MAFFRLMEKSVQLAAIWRQLASPAFTYRWPQAALPRRSPMEWPFNGALNEPNHVKKQSDPCEINACAGQHPNQCKDNRINAKKTTSPPRNNAQTWQKTVTLGAQVRSSRYTAIKNWYVRKSKASFASEAEK